MSSDITTGNDYAIELPGRGFITGRHVYGIVIDDQPVYTSFLDEAQTSLKSARERYKSLGVPEIGDQLRIITRTVTVTRGDWEPLPAKIDPHDQDRIDEDLRRQAGRRSRVDHADSAETAFNADASFRS